MPSALIGFDPMRLWKPNYVFRIGYSVSLKVKAARGGLRYDMIVWLAAPGPPVQVGRNRNRRDDDEAKGSEEDQ